MLLALKRATSNRIEIDNRNDNEQRADWSLVQPKNIPLRFLGSEKMNDLQPRAKLKKLTAETWLTI